MTKTREAIVAELRSLNFGSANEPTYIRKCRDEARARQIATARLHTALQMEKTQNVFLQYGKARCLHKQQTMCVGCQKSMIFKSQIMTVELLCLLKAASSTMQWSELKCSASFHVIMSSALHFFPSRCVPSLYDPSFSNFVYLLNRFRIPCVILLSLPCLLKIFRCLLF